MLNATMTTINVATPKPTSVHVQTPGADAVGDDEYFGNLVDGDDGTKAEDSEQRNWQ